MPVGQLLEHTAPEQLALPPVGAEQTSQHDPQLAASVTVLVQVPPQLFGVAPAHTHVPVPSQLPPAGAMHAPVVRGDVTLQTALLPEHTMVPVCWQPPLPIVEHTPPMVWHTPPQLVIPLGQPVTHADPEQPAMPPVGATQTCPHAPQLALSLTVLVQVPAQLFGVAPPQTQVPVLSHAPPAGAMHAPVVRGAVTLHAVPAPEHTVIPVCWQPPLPVVVHTPPMVWHTPPQLVIPVGQLLEHTEPVQLALPPVGAVQAWPHAPQLATLDPRFVSQPSDAIGLQSPKPMLQANPHVPDAHVADALAGEAQALPHDPQLPTSVIVVAHTSVTEQKVVPVGHELTHVPDEQCVPAMHDMPHAPQLVLVLSTASQPLAARPSQSP